MEKSGDRLTNRLYVPDQTDGEICEHLVKGRGAICTVMEWTKTGPYFSRKKIKPVC
jgi:hypothetical protein